MLPEDNTMVGSLADSSCPMSWPSRFNQLGVVIAAQRLPGRDGQCGNGC